MKVGDYVRTIYGIKKVDDIVYGQDVRFDNTDGFDDDLKKYHDYDGIIFEGSAWREIVERTSPNIIDLIEENDIVNHSRVVCIGVSTDLSGTHKYLVLENGSNCANGNIKSIVTKEQFSQMEYKIQ